MTIKAIDPESLMVRVSFKWKIKAPLPISYSSECFEIQIPNSNIQFDLLNLALENLIYDKILFIILWVV